MKITTVSVKGHGDVVVTKAIDVGGNDRMIPLAGAATLSQWREDKTLLPPWLLPADLADGQDWAGIMHALSGSS